MNQYIKKGMRTLGALASATICTFTLSYAQSNQAEQYSLEKIVEVYKEYDKLINKTLEDQKITIDEIQLFNDYLDKHLLHFPKNQQELYKKIKGVVDKNKAEEIDKIVFELENKICKNYPGFLGDYDDINITYSANDKLEEKDNIYLKTLVEQSEKCVSNSLLIKELKNKKEFTFKDLTTFYLYIKATSKKGETKNLDVDVLNLFKHKKIYEKSLERYNLFKEEANKKYISGSVASYLDHYGNDSSGRLKVVQYYCDRDFLAKKLGKRYNKNNKNEIKLVDFGCIDDTVEFETKLPWYAWIPLSFLGAGFIKWGITKYTRRKMDVCDLGLDWITNPTAGFLLLDWIHPLVLPTRLIAGPIITEAIRGLARKADKSRRNRYYR